MTSSNRGTSLALAVVVALAVPAFGCGSSGKGNGSSRGPARSNAMAYSACMRKNGVPNFPDPDSRGRVVLTSGQTSFQAGTDVNSPQLQRAQRACQSLRPAGGRPSARQEANAQQQMLKYAECMRSHGVEKFPDPGAGKQLDVGKRSGIDPNAPAFKSAQQACQTLVPHSALSTTHP
jgi:hypothetical protein